MLRPRERQRTPRFAYYPFGGGPRLCIGNNFALMEATLVIAMVTQRYRLDLMPGQTIKAHPKGSLRPRPGVWAAPHKTYLHRRDLSSEKQRRALSR